MVFDQKYQKPRENHKKPKKQNCNPNSPACAYMGLAILFFLCSLFLWFSRVFFWFLTKSIKNPRKPKKSKKQNADPNSPACAYMGLAIFFNCFFVFSRFLPKYQNLEKTVKTSRKPKKNCRPYLTSLCLHGSCNFVFFCVLCFCGFLEVFFWFLTKSIKNLEKTIKNRKKQNCNPNSPACAYMGLAILFFFCFFVFSRFLPKYQNGKNLEKTKKKQKKQNCRPLTHQLVPTWVLQFCFFLCSLFC